MESFLQILLPVLVILFFLFRQAKRTRPSNIPDAPKDPALSEPKPVRKRPTSTFEELLRELTTVKTKPKEDPQAQQRMQQARARQQKEDSLDQKLKELDRKIAAVEARQRQYEDEMEELQHRQINWKRRLQHAKSAKDAVVMSEIFKRKF